MEYEVKDMSDASQVNVLKILLFYMNLKSTFI
jgi:hypothetical protein